MSTMNISLPAKLRAFVDAQVTERGYGTSSEYVREVIRKDHERLHLRALLLAGAESPEGPPSDAAKPVVPRRGALRDIDEVPRRGDFGPQVQARQKCRRAWPPRRLALPGRTILLRLRRAMTRDAGVDLRHAVDPVGRGGERCQFLVTTGVNAGRKSDRTAD